MTMGCGVYLWLVCVSGLLLDKGQGKNKNYSDSVQVKMVSMCSEKPITMCSTPVSQTFFFFPNVTFEIVPVFKHMKGSNEHYLLGQNTKRVLINSIPLNFSCVWTLF